MSEVKQCSCLGPHFSNCPFRHQVRNQGIRADFSDFQRTLEKIVKEFNPHTHKRRDPKRISKILKRLGKLWERHPDLCLGQLIENAVRGSLYYVEDNRLIKELEKFYKNRK